MKLFLLGLSIAILTFAVGMLFVQFNTRPPVVPSSSKNIYTSDERDPMASRHEVYASPLRATAEFNARLQQASQLTKHTPCFDETGRRTGERAVLYVMPPYVPQGTWQIMWTQQNDDFSEFFKVESASLSDAQQLETTELKRWKKCGVAK